MGENMKFEIVIAFVDLATPDPLDEVVLDEFALDEVDPPPLLHAARSSAPARTRTSAPPLCRRVRWRMA